MARGLVRGTALTFALFCSGCYTGYLKLPSEGGPPWLELTSEHFVVQTDLDEPAARAQVQQLEDLRSALVAATWRGATFPSRRVQVVSFQRLGELHEFVPELVAGIWRVDWTGEKRLVLSWEPDRRIHEIGVPMGNVSWTVRVVAQEVAAHELTHELASACFARQPRWLAEGLAVFLQSIALDRASNLATVGRPPRRRSAFVPPLGPVLRGEVLDEEAAGWIVFFLVNRKQAAFEELQAALMRGDAAQAAWDRALPEYLGEEGVARLKTDVVAFLEAPAFKSARVAFVPWRGAVAVRPMPEDEVRVLRGGLYANGFGTLSSKAELEAKARLDAEGSLAARPGNAAALGLLVQLEPSREKRLALAREAARAHPEEPLALIAVDAALGEQQGTADEEGLRLLSLLRARALAPDNVVVLERLGAALLRAGDLAGAEEATRAALRLLPDRIDALDTLAQVAAARGDFAAAATFEERALERLPDLPPPAAPGSAPEPELLRKARAMSRRLDDYRSKAAVR